DLVRADDRANLVVQDLSGGPGERAQAEIAESPEIRVEVEVERGSALPDLERGERVDVDVLNRRLDRLDDARVVVARERRVDAALQAHLGRPALPRLVHAPDDL